MCGRYALGIRASFVRYQLQQQGMPVDDVPEDDQARETHNFPPGAYGLVYRAEVPDEGLRDVSNSPGDSDHLEDAQLDQSDDPKTENTTQSFKYELKVMKWGLIPFWTKRSPDYGSMLRTINCRDDSLIENRGMWTTMKQRKRCIVVAQGFYEWLKKGPGGKEKVPHFVKRKDGNLMCFAGLWDCVKYEGSVDKLYSYTIITTDSNKQLNFLHDRMPVILEPDTKDMNIWLDPTRTKWTKDLQMLLKPFQGELDCYPVNAEVGKVGNNSPDFIIPVDSKNNPKNIANFFGNAKRLNEIKVEKESVEDRETKDHENSENHAPLPVPADHDVRSKRKRGETDTDGLQSKQTKSDEFATPTKSSSTMKIPTSRKTRSATSNEGLGKTPSPAKSTLTTQRITNFFGKQ